MPKQKNSMNTYSHTITLHYCRYYCTVGVQTTVGVPTTTVGVQTTTLTGTLLSA